MRKDNDKGYGSFLEPWLHGDGSFICMIMMGVKSIFFRLLTFPCGYSWERDYNNVYLTSFLYANTQSNPQLLLTSSCPRSSFCAHNHWRSRPPKHCCPWVHLLRWRPTITFLRSVRKRHHYSLRPLFSWWCGDRHCFRSALHRARRLHQQALCRLVHPALPLDIFLLYN